MGDSTLDIIALIYNAIDTDGIIKASRDYANMMNYTLGVTVESAE